MSVLKDFLFGKARGKSMDEYKVEFTSYSYHFDDYRMFTYRVVPSELSLLKRLFWNATLDLYHCRRDYNRAVRESTFSKEEYYNTVHNMHTLGDVKKYLAEQDALIEAENNRLKKAHKLWPDD
jgi:hypothetical protein